VAVDQVRPQVLHRPVEVRGRVVGELPPAVEELVALAVPLGQRPALVRVVEPQVRQGSPQRDRVLQRADARLAQQEEDAHQRRLLIALAGFPTATE
jgi:hypothetical protein